MNRLIRKYQVCGLVFLLALPFCSWAQLPTDNITVINTLGRITKNAIKIGENPRIENDTTQKLELKYTILKKEVETDFQVDHIKPARIGKEPLKKLYHSYVKGGFGNYTTPLFELSVNKLRSKKTSMGVFLHHQSSAGKLKNVGFSGYSDNEASLFADRYFNNYTLEGAVDYKRNVVHYYGFDNRDSILSDSLTKNNIKQRFSYIAAHVGLVQSKKNKPKWLKNISLDYYNLMDIDSAVENNVQLNFGLNKGIKKNGIFTFDAMLDYYNHKFGSTSWDNFIFELKPMVGMRGKRGEILIGASLAFDINSDSTETHVYPQALGHYTVVENILEFYGEVNGSVGKNSFRSLTLDNPFILANGNLQNTNNQVVFKGGLRGVFSPKMTFNVMLSEGFHADQAFFVNDTSNGSAGNQFDVVYDDISVFNIRGELGFQSSEKFSTLARLDYFNYTMDKELKPWHTPSIRGQLGVKYNLKDKIIVKADVYYLGEQYARTYAVDTTLSNPIVVEATKLKGLVDVNLGAEYRYSKLLSAFVNFNNVAAFRYYRWNQYPSQRFNFIIGVTYSF